MCSRFIECYRQNDSKANWETIYNIFQLSLINNGIKETCDRYHQNFQASLRAHPLGYKSVKLGISTTPQLEVRTRARAKMLVKGHVPTRL